MEIIRIILKIIRTIIAIILFVGGIHLLPDWGKGVIFIAAAIGWLYWEEIQGEK